MSRLLKFRCWWMNQHVMQHEPSGQLHGGVLEHSSHWIYMQWSGLLDKNGKEIFEDDIVELLFLHPVKGPYKRKARVLFADFRWWFQMLEPVGARVEMIWLESNWQRKCEVIGNIYEHPELIDKKAKEDNG